jgi:hypothetical protein
MILGRPLDWVCGRRGVLPADPRQRIGKRRLEARTGEESAGHHCEHERAKGANAAPLQPLFSNF